MRDEAATVAARALARPIPARVELTPDGVPRAVDGVHVEGVREDWLVEDRWWSGLPLCRRYFEVVLAGGSAVVVFFDLVDGSWHRQRA